MKIKNSLINPTLVEPLKLALTEGFRAFVVTPSENTPRRIDFIYLCLDIEGSFVLLEAAPTRVEPFGLSAPITPSREYGSSVLVDYDGSNTDAIRAMREVCQNPNVAVRFMANTAPVVPNRGKKSLEKWHNGVLEITANDGTAPVEL